MNTILNSALAYAKLGIRVFPIGNKTKVPGVVYVDRTQEILMSIAKKCASDVLGLAPQKGRVVIMERCLWLITQLPESK